MAKGFSLLEMVIVLGIIALILGAAITFSGGITGAAKEQAAEAKMREISAKLEAYSIGGGMYPSEEQGLQALVERPTSPPEPKIWNQGFVSLPVDPWGGHFLYETPNPNEYRLSTKGPDGVRNTDDDIRYNPSLREDGWSYGRE